MAGTDGLFDNMFDKVSVRDWCPGSPGCNADLLPPPLRPAQELQEIVARHMKMGTTDPFDISQELAETAHKHAGDSGFRSPYAVALEATGQVPLMFRLTGVRGGKMDDCTVVVGIVS